jgi:hypothetical protein
MKPKHITTPLDKEALVLLPGLRYARAMIDLAMKVCRHTAMQAAAKAQQTGGGESTKADEAN